MGQYTSNGGNSWGQSGVTASGKLPSLAVSTSGDVSVAYTFSNNPFPGDPGDGIYFSRSTNGGQTWGLPVEVYPTGSLPHITIDPTDNKALIMFYEKWYGSGPAPSYNISFKKEL